MGGGFPSENKLQEKGTLILTSPLEDLVSFHGDGLVGARYSGLDVRISTPLLHDRESRSVCGL